MDLPGHRTSILSKSDKNSEGFKHSNSTSSSHSKPLVYKTHLSKTGVSYPTATQ